MKKIIFLFLFFSYNTENNSAQNCNLINQLVEEGDSVFNLSDKNIAFTLDTINILLENCLDSKDSINILIGDLIHNKGIAFFGQYNEKAALAFFKTSTLIRTRYYGFSHEETSKGYFMQSLSNYYLELKDEAIETAKLAIQAVGNTENPQEESLLAKYYGHLSNCYFVLGDYGQASFYNQASFDVFPDKDDYEKHRYYQSKGKINLKQKNYERAIEDYKKAKQYIQETDAFAQATTVNDLGYIYQELDRPKKAASFYQAALKYYKLANSENMEIANTYANLITISTQLDQFQKVGEYFQKGLAIALANEPSGFHPLIAELHYNKADAATKQEKYDIALYHLKEGIRALIPSLKTKNFPAHFSVKENAIGDRMRLLTLLSVKIETLQGQYNDSHQKEDLIESAKTFATIDTLITQIRRGFKAADSKYYLQGNVVPLYEKAILNALQLFKVSKDSTYLQVAYRYVATNKAIILLEGLQDENAKFSRIPKELLEEEKQLKVALHELETNLYDAQKTKEDSLSLISNITQKLLTRKRQYEQLINLFETDYTHYFELKYAQQSPLSIAEIQEKLASNRTVVEFFVGRENLFVFTISRTEFSYYEIDMTEDFKNLVFEYRTLLQEDNLIKKQFSAVAYRLFERLLEKPLNNLNSNIDRLILIPDNFLLQIPFDALLTEQYDIPKWNDKAIPYLIKKYTTDLAYSNRLIFDDESNQRIEDAHNGFLGLGLEYDSRNLQKQILSENFTIDSLIKRNIKGRLFESDDEVREIGNIVSGDVFTNELATKATLKEYLPKCKIGHIAGHGFVDEDNPWNSGLILYKSTDTTDNILRAGDVLNMELAADMIVLSACQTGYGPLTEGVGMRTIAQAFSYASCPSIIASLWNIPDGSTKKILVEFYKNLKEYQPKDIALRNAKLEYLKSALPNASSPSHWAHIVLIGEAESLDLGTPYPYRWSMLLLIGLTLLFFCRNWVKI